MDEILDQWKKQRGNSVSKSNSLKDLPGGPVAKTLFPMQGAQVWSPVRELDSHMPQLKTPHATRKTEDPVYCN